MVVRWWGKITKMSLGGKTVSSQKKKSKEKTRPRRKKNY